MKNFNLNDLLPSPYGTFIQFSGNEESVWLVEGRVIIPGALDPCVVKIKISGVIQARFNHEDDKNELFPEFIFVRENSPWVEKHLSEHKRRFGSDLISFSNGIKHLIIGGQEITIGLLARNVEISEVM